MNKEAQNLLHQNFDIRILLDDLLRNADFFCGISPLLKGGIFWGNIFCGIPQNFLDAKRRNKICAIKNAKFRALLNFLKMIKFEKIANSAIFHENLLTLFLIKIFRNFF